MFEQVKKIIVETLNCDESKITMDARLAEDLEADSLDAVELNMALEEALGYGVSDEALAEMKTVGDIVSWLEKNKG
ncbi:MAG: acyl carrier protein [Oscillospiraceae bacterium]|nr:acyl carrier protein [Oscillospiraceae bacterium]